MWETKTVQVLLVVISLVPAIFGIEEVYTEKKWDTVAKSKVEVYAKIVREVLPERWKRLLFSRRNIVGCKCTWLYEGKRHESTGSGVGLEFNNIKSQSFANQKLTRRENFISKSYTLQSFIENLTRPETSNSKPDTLCNFIFQNLTRRKFCKPKSDVWRKFLFLNLIF